MRWYRATSRPEGSGIDEKKSTKPASASILYRRNKSWRHPERRRIAACLLAFAICFPALSRAQEPEDTPQITPRTSRPTKKKDAGPRALALLQLAANGKATLIPIAIKVDNKFYDATAYKADPVPMALDSGVVYEAERTGTSIGLFTVNGALESNAANNPRPWIGTGSWLPAGTEPAKTGLKAEKEPIGIETTDEPPRLTRGTTSAQPNSKSPTGSAPSPGSSSPSNPTGGTQPKTEPPKAEPPKSTPAPETKAPEKKEPADTGTSSGEDAYRPRLRRGKPTEPLPGDEEVPGYSDPRKPRSEGSAAAQPKSAAAASQPAVQLIPAISDADGPDPRSYAFEWDKGEAENRRKQMLALANQQILAYLKNEAQARIGGPPPASKPAATRRQTAKQPQPILENVQLRTFDLWSNNQPVLVLSATAHMPPSSGVAPAPDATYSVTLVARTDIYSNLHTLYAGVTDQFHLDVTPRLDLIDVVDADGDGRGELLFQETSDAGTGYVIYRAAVDKLWKMFDSLNPE